MGWQQTTVVPAECWWPLIPPHEGNEGQSIQEFVIYAHPIGFKVPLELM